MDNSPIVTVIIPTYNHAHFLKEALSSLLGQTFTDWEAIVVNNFSEDDTVSVVESFADSRIILENFSNKGVIAASRNRGIKLARGKYIAFLDSDDTWFPEKLAKCLVAFVNDVSLVCHGLQWFGDQKRDMFCGPEKRASFEALLDYGNCITPSATVVLKEWVESVGCFSEDPRLVTSEDYHLWLKLAKENIKVYCIREILGQYRIHSGNQSGSVLRHMNASLSVINEFFPKQDVSQNIFTRIRIRRCYCRIYYGAGRAMQHKGQFFRAFPLLFRAIAYSPFFMKSYIAVLVSLVGVVRK
ncbi:MAG: glycosyltransferase [Rhodobacterales bacterium]|jgi:glycosyltransferase involved in cell wall biosynthesis|nr:glycosyltransferase [Rhodobacterales bacterium]